MGSVERPDHALAVGARVLVGGRWRATVRYLGPVEGQDGEWVGLEWDDPARGRHGGEHGGRRYFTCVHAAGAGSLVRLPKLLATAHLGATLAEAAEARYNLGDGKEGAAAGAAEFGHAVELVGAERHEGAAAPAALAAARAAGLEGAPVALPGPAPRLRAALGAVAHLDLSGTLVGTWRVAAELAAALPALRTLNLSGCRLHELEALPAAAAPRENGGGGAPPEEPAPLSLAPAPALRTLVLNGVGFSWARAAAALGAAAPGLRDLRLRGNGITSLVLREGGGGDAAAGDADGAARLAAAFPALEELDLEDNALSDWRAALPPLRALPALRALGLSGNAALGAAPGAGAHPGGFAALRALTLGGCGIGSWAAVDALAAFPALEELRLSGNPLPRPATGSARYDAAARLGRLARLNGGGVGRAERWDAEVAYLRAVAAEAAAAAGAAADAAAARGGAAAEDAARAAARARAAAEAAHPRYAELAARYGAPEPAAPEPGGAGGGGGGGGGGAPRALASGMVELVLARAGGGGGEVRRRLPASLTVGRLKLLLERLLGVPAPRQALRLVPSGGAGQGGEDITADDGRELRWFEPADGWRLEVGDADPAARAAAAAAAAAAGAEAQRRAAEEQERALRTLRVEEERLMG